MFVVALTFRNRKKNIFKLSQGEYVAAEKIENIYGRASLVAQCFVYGDSYQSCLVAIVVPDFEEVRKKLASAGSDRLANASAEDIARDANVKAMLLESMRITSEEGNLKGFEKVKDIYVEASEFTVENGLLTPSFKLKRPQARDHYKAQIDEMYVALNTVPAHGR